MPLGEALHIQLGSDEREFGERDPLRWALGHLRSTLADTGVDVEIGREIPVGCSALRVVVARRDHRWGRAALAGYDVSVPCGPEAFVLTRPGGDRGPIVVVGDHERGLAYGVLELADIVADEGDPLARLASVMPTSQAPATPVRSVLRAFACADDIAWLHDREFWKHYLTELAVNRVNRVQLALGMQYNYGDRRGVRDNYLCFAYPFLVDAPGYDVRAEGVSATERDRNLAALRFASDEAARRGIHFQLGLWNHAFDHGWNSDPTYPIQGLTAANHASYSGVALEQVLRACPSIAGLTLRVHFEGGVPEPDRDAFWGEVLSGLARAGRPVEIDMHAKGVDDSLYDVARQTGQPIVLSAKYWAEHMGLPYHQASIRETEKPRQTPGTGFTAITEFTRKHTRYGYGDYLHVDRDFDLIFRVWPGTQKLLLWGDPVFAAGYGRHATLGGAVGAELCEPLTFWGRHASADGDRDPYVDPTLRLGRESWRKYRYTYRLWGRLLYDPDADPQTWRRFLRREYGAAAEHVETALAATSRVLPLVTVTHCPSACNNDYWPELYLDMPVVEGPHLTEYAWDTGGATTFGQLSPLDPALFARVDEHADELVAGKRGGKYSPEDVAGWLSQLADTAEASLAVASDLATDPANPIFRRLSVDVRCLVGLARFFAGKMRASLACALYERTNDPAHLEQGLAAYTAARDAYATVAEVTTGVYRNPLGFGSRATEHGHWTDRLEGIDADLAALKQWYSRAAAEPVDPYRQRPVPMVPRGKRDVLRHCVPARFEAGVDLTLHWETDAGDQLDEVVVHYRHLNQGEEYQTVQAQRIGPKVYEATVPGSYTDSSYPISYYVTVFAACKDAWIEPGLDQTLANQPYYIVHPHSR